LQDAVRAPRGRPAGSYHSYSDIRLLEYLARISVKYEVDTAKFFKSLLEAFEHEEAVCGDLWIKCRVKTKGHAVFLISNDHKVIAQFPVPEYILAKNNPISEFTLKLASVRNTAQKAGSSHLQIKDLKVGMKHVNIKARVVELSQPRVVTTRFGFYANVMDALIADESGTIQLPLWNKQTDEICVGELIQVENASVIMFRGVRQLKVARSGKVSITKNS